MAENKLQIVIEAVDKATEDLRKVQKEVDNLRDKLDKAEKKVNDSANSSKGLGKSLVVANLATQAITRSFGFLSGQFSESIQLANEYQKSVTGLNSTAAAFGESQDAARQAVQRLTQDGLLSFADASKSIQNLLTTGIGLDKATQLMDAYKTQAALGRAENISFSSAVANLSESFLTESSAIGNLSGQSENYNQILERGAGIMGKTVANLTDTERQMAKFIGTMEIGKVTAGDLELYLGTADAQAQIFANTVDKLQIMFGQALSPAVMYAVQSLSAMASDIEGNASPALLNLAKGLVYLVGVARVVGKVFVEMGQAIANSMKGPQVMIEKAMSGDFIGAITAPWQNTFNSFKDSFIDVGSEVDKVSQDLSRINGKIDKDGLGAFGNVFKEKAQFAASEVSKAGDKIADKLKKIGEDVNKELENYARSSADKLRSFTESMQGLVVQHRNAMRDLRTEIGDLNREFNEAAAERLSEHSDRKGDIEGRYKDETEVLRENLARRLTETTQSDAQLTTFFQAQLAEKEAQKNEELRKEDEKFAKEESKQVASHNKQLSALETKLNAEMEIERKHRAEFEKFKDVVEQDDITRLQTSFAREMEELKKQHDEKMSELRKQQEEIISLRAATESSVAKKVEEIAKTRKPTVTAPPKTIANASYAPPASRPVYASFDPNLKKYHDGGVIPGTGEVPILAKGGEAVLTGQQTQGLMDLLKNLGGGMKATVPNLQMTNNIYNQVDLVGAMREMGWRARIR